jgi:hypothetical protein
VTRLTLAAAIAAPLLIAVGLGWLLHWLWTRMLHAQDPEAARAARLTAQLHAAEAALAAAEARAAAAEAAARAARLAAETEAQALGRQLRAELDAAMGALGEARRESAEWRAAYEDFAGRAAREAD